MHYSCISMTISDHSKGRFLAFKDSCDYIVSTWIIKNELPISRFLIERCLPNALCLVRSNIHRSQGLGGHSGVHCSARHSHLTLVHLGHRGCGDTYSYFLGLIQRWCGMLCVMHIMWCLLHSVYLESASQTWVEAKKRKWTRRPVVWRK